MALTGTSTYADALAQYKDNVEWDGDPVKAKAFRAAIRWLLLDRPTRTTASDGCSIDRERLEQQLSAVTEYLVAQDTNVGRCSFVRGRALL